MKVKELELVGFKLNFVHSKVYKMSYQDGLSTCLDNTLINHLV